MRNNQFDFSVRHLETVAEASRFEAEKRWLKSFDGGLLNITDGGPGMSGHSFRGTEHAKRIAWANRTGKPKSNIQGLMGVAGCAAALERRRASR